MVFNFNIPDSRPLVDQHWAKLASVSMTNGGPKLAHRWRNIGPTVAIFLAAGGLTFKIPRHFRILQPNENNMPMVIDYGPCLNI